MKDAIKISFSNLIRVDKDSYCIDVGTYDGNTYSFNDFSERAVDNLWQYLQENKDPMLDLPEVKAEPSIIAEALFEAEMKVYKGFDKEICRVAKLYLMDIVKPVFYKYGVKVGKFSYSRPREYNFRTDELDLEVKADFTADKYVMYKEELRTEIEYYLKEIRKESCSGYMSFEPDEFDKVEATDYAYLWAILKKEGLLEDISELFEDEIYSELSDYLVYGLDDAYLERLTKGVKGRFYGTAGAKEKYVLLKLKK